ncbi:60S acidic ribosomal protein P1-like [Diospyros lotus]|uniref:60S acidic ribosomal protein P1-like n=1 Tax=Diospyros lotus TaxID=55363 RepID=UPI00225025B0|nr:60S acidic ribosomal protein P1-like [Diospyros lotus]
MSDAGEIACTYAILILYDDGIPITAEKINAIIKAANVRVEPYLPSLFAKLVQKRNVDDLILNVGSGGGAAAVATAAAPAADSASAAAPSAPPTDTKVEVVDDSDGDIGFSLFDD